MGLIQLLCFSSIPLRVGGWVTLLIVLLQELSKITMPVIFNEPLSFLQRVVEYMEYGRLIERASASDDPIERHEVSCFRVSIYMDNMENLEKSPNFKLIIGKSGKKEKIKAKSGETEISFTTWCIFFLGVIQCVILWLTIIFTRHSQT